VAAGTTARSPDLRVSTVACTLQQKSNGCAEIAVQLTLIAAAAARVSRRAQLRDPGRTRAANRILYVYLPARRNSDALLQDRVTILG
jgi:hypothetical protein